MSVVDKLVAACENDEGVIDALNTIKNSHEKLSARLIRNAMMPARARLQVGTIKNADFYAAYAQITNTPLQGDIVSQSVDIAVPVQNVTYIYGRDVATLAKHELIDAIKKAKADTKNLLDVGVESEYIAGQVADLNNAIAAMVALLDA